MFLNHRLLYVILLCSYCTIGESILPWCRCNCCPGEQCRAHVLNFTVDICDQKSCSFERCYKMYPDQCGLIPGITNHSCQHDHSSTNIRTVIDVSSSGTLKFVSTTTISFVLLVHKTWIKYE